MTVRQQATTWTIAIAAFLGVLYVLGDVLTPFVAGMAIAYLLDPACDKLERMGCSRTLSTSIITGAFFILMTLLLLLLAPLVTAQLVDFAQKVPQYITILQEKAVFLMGLLENRLGPDELTQLRDMFGSLSSGAVKFLLSVVGGVASGVESLLTLVSLALITPIVTFYLLRDWDHMVAKIDGWLPRGSADVIRTQIGLVNETLSGFARGQAMVCIILGLFYGVALMLAGLDFGFIVGFLTGLISFVPYFGMLVGFVAGVSIAIAQFGEVGPVVIVAVIFAVGQVLEGNILTPKLVGERVGLHAVWIIFALLAGGSLLGFVGILLAVPLMAVIGVLARFSLEQYLRSPLYGAPATVEPPADTPSSAPDEKTS
ncbi:MAG: AI-2E family transporter [Alphaproteobacteria bacterium]|nr:AI-2E family transporter [Alphaproteobacteria bacterium]